MKTDSWKVFVRLTKMFSKPFVPLYINLIYLDLTFESNTQGHQALYSQMTKNRLVTCIKTAIRTSALSDKLIGQIPEGHAELIPMLAVLIADQDEGLGWPQIEVRAGTLHDGLS